ncbi:hypothetical protein PFICI_03596 [Pestalotiopsis fici W106-1]|uniref:CENP-V/GFA domain-containing protein n=1 Tax=Pestalotiopsis fici (strain W106-1 / CGMCC3.15140) TaxID=1229662 RepID=W3XJZ9_PESFW|nr:uncharacterized protein PFICI_03596 [Pestalotiopsis fici W106-1]ETS85571.1 hypothetical protein PFICI_03596 [Pestalotiopsis fici W106-1]
MAHDTIAPAKPEGPFSGGCACRAVRYTLPKRPIYIHACHCRYCQRETGSAFALNAMYESHLVHLVPESQQPELVQTPAASGNPQTIARCPACRVAVWSHYGGLGDRLKIVRVGTLDEPDTWGFAPEMHIYTSTKQPWVLLNGDVPQVAEYYDRKDYWPQERLDRFAKAFA